MQCPRADAELKVLVSSDSTSFLLDDRGEKRAQRVPVCTPASFSHMLQTHLRLCALDPVQVERFRVMADTILDVCYSHDTRTLFVLDAWNLAGEPGDSLD